MRPRRACGARALGIAVRRRPPRARDRVGPRRVIRLAVDRAVQRLTRLPLPGRGRLAVLAAGAAPPVTVDSVRAGGHRLRMRLDKRDAIQFHLHYFGRWEPETVRLLVERLRPGDTFLDVGANVGYFSLLAARLVGPAGRVLSFEPVAATREALAANLRLNGLERVEVVPAALADRPGERMMHYYPGRDSGSHSLAPHARDAGGEPVQVTTVDACVRELSLGRIALAKIDVEGAELQVLRGGRGTLGAPGAPDLVLELNPARLAANGCRPEEVLAFLDDCGYRVRTIARAKGYSNVWATKRGQARRPSGAGGI